MALVPQLASIVGGVDITGTRVGTRLYLLQEYMVCNSHMITLPFEGLELRLLLHLAIILPSRLLLLITLFDPRLVQQLLGRQA